MTAGCDNQLGIYGPAAETVFGLYRFGTSSECPVLRDYQG